MKVKKYSFLKVVGVVALILAWFYLRFDIYEKQPNDGEGRLSEMKVELSKFQPALGKYLFVSERYKRVNSSLVYQYLNSKKISKNDIRKLFLNFGWVPVEASSRNGTYEVFCKNLIQARHYDKKGNIHIALHYSRGSPCYPIK